MLGENFNSDIIRRHYFDRHEQALAFLLTIGAKALVLQTQREQQMLSSTSLDNEESISSAHPSGDLRTPSHRHAHLSDPSPLEEDALPRESVRTQDSLSLWSSEVSGMNDEAETRLRIVHQERLRSLRRKLLEKKPMLVYKRGRNHKMRLIELVIQHDRQRETYAMWRSKMNTLKKVEIDCNTLVELLPHQRIEEDEAADLPFPLSQGKREKRVSLSPLEEDAQSSRSYTQPPTHSHTHILAQLVRSSSTALPRNDSDASLSSSSTKRLLTGQQSSSAAPAVSIASHNIFTQHLTPWLHDNKSSQQHKSQNNDVFATHSYASTKSKTSSTRSHSHYYTQRYLSHAYSSFHQNKQKPVPFLRLKSKTRYLELQFLSHVELEAFLLVLQKSAELSFELDGSLLPENTILPVQSKAATS